MEQRLVSQGEEDVHRFTEYACDTERSRWLSPVLLSRSPGRPSLRQWSVDMRPGRHFHLPYPLHDSSPGMNGQNNRTAVSDMGSVYAAQLQAKLQQAAGCQNNGQKNCIPSANVMAKTSEDLGCRNNASGDDDDSQSPASSNHRNTGCVEEEDASDDRSTPRSWTKDDASCTKLAANSKALTAS